MYVYYYSYNSAYIPIVDPINFFVLIACFVLVYGGSFAYFFVNQKMFAQDPEREVISNNQNAPEGDEYAKDEDEELAKAPEDSQEVNPSIGADSLDQN